MVVTRSQVQLRRWPPHAGTRPEADQRATPAQVAWHNWRGNSLKFPRLFLFVWMIRTIRRAHDSPGELAIEHACGTANRLSQAMRSRQPAARRRDLFRC